MVPVVLGGIALVSAAFGLNKGYDAKGKNKKANKIINNIQNEFNEVKSLLEVQGEELNKELEEFAKFKLNIFMNQIKNLLELIKKCKNSAKSQFQNEHIDFSPEEIEILENSVKNSLEIYSGIGKGLASGTLTAFGAYSGVGFLATASTGTAISTLSGAAAESAILAWLGGGSIAAGGGGVALGTTVLGGIVAGPAIAILGLTMDSKAEKNLTKAREYEKDLKLKIEKMNYSIEELKIVSKRIQELKDVIEKISNRFDITYNNLIKDSILNRIKAFFNKKQICKNKTEMNKLLTLGKSLKLTLDISLLEKDGSNNKNFKKEIEKVKLK